MATTGKVNSTLGGAYFGGTLIAHLTGASLSIDHSPRDVSTKDSGAWAESLEGQLSFSGSVSGYFSFDASYGPEEIDDIITGRTQVVFRLSTESSGDTYWEGSTYLGNLTFDSPGQNETMTFSAEVQGTGALTIGSVA